MNLATGHQRRSLPGRALSPAVAIVGITALATALLVGPVSAFAQAAGVTVASLDCEASPEVVQLTNSGSEAVDLTGWSLQSDPSTESYDLTAAGTLTAGASVFINSGSGATGAFVWSTAEIFRNGDATDFVSLMDAGGAVVGTVNCPASTPAANGIPDGGGPPGESSALAAGVVAAAAGALLVVLTTVLGLVWMGIGLLKRGRAVDAPEILERPPEPAPETNEAAVGEAASYDAAPSGPIPAHVPPGAVAADARSEANLWPYLIFVVGAIAMVVILLLAGSAGSRKK